MELYRNPSSVSKPGNTLSLEGMSSGRSSSYMRNAVNNAKVEYIKAKSCKLKYTERRPSKSNRYNRGAVLSNFTWKFWG